MGRVRVGKITDVAPGTTKQVVVDGVEVLLCNVDGTIYAIDDVCTHDGGPLEQGLLDGHEIECPRHGARFDVRTGEVTCFPAVTPVASYRVSREGDDVFVDL